MSRSTTDFARSLSGMEANTGSFDQTLVVTVGLKRCSGMWLHNRKLSGPFQASLDELRGGVVNTR